jgi:hypothetical protein
VYLSVEVIGGDGEAGEEWVGVHEEGEGGVSGGEERGERGGLDEGEAFEAREGTEEGEEGGGAAEIAVVEGEDAEAGAGREGGEGGGREGGAGAKAEAFEGGAKVGEEAAEVGGGECCTVVEVEAADAAVGGRGAHLLQEEEAGSAEGEEHGEGAVAALAAEQLVQQRLQHRQIARESPRQRLAGVPQQCTGRVRVIRQRADGRERLPGAVHRAVQRGGGGGCRGGSIGGYRGGSMGGRRGGRMGGCRGDQ